MSIVKMKHVKLLALNQDQQTLLAQLERLGCVEIAEPTDKLADPDWTALLGRNTSGLGQVKAQLNELSAAQDALKKYAGVKNSLLKLRSPIQEEDLFDPERLADALAHARAVNDSVSALAQLNSRENQLNAQRASLLPWTTLDLPLETGSTEHVEIVMGALPATSSLNDLRGELAQAAPLAEVIPVSADKEQQYILLLCHKSQWADAQATMKPYSFSATRLKDQKGTAAENIAALDQALAEIAAQRQAEIEKIKTHADSFSALQVITDRLNQDAAREAAQERAMTDGTIVFLEGWVPAAKVDKVQKVLDTFDAAYSFRDPEEGDDVPTLLENPRWMYPINMVTEMYSLPAYGSVDPNPIMTPFFVLFYGMMMADMGYGILMMIASVVVKKKANPRGTMGQLFGLMGMCGITTFIFGAVTGGFFGDFLTQLAQLINPESTFALPSLFTPLNDTMAILVGAMALGGVHLITGMAVNFYKLTRRGQFWDAVMDVGSWWLLFAGAAVGVLTGFWYVAIAGVLALILTQGRHSPTIIGKLAGGVSSLYDITSYFGDVLSYSRLMALMLAGSVISQVFNTLGAIPGNIVIFIVISMAGNALNFALNLLSCYVHDLRLQCLEFFGKFYEDGGRPFAPMSYQTTKYVDVIEK